MAMMRSFQVTFDKCNRGFRPSLIWSRVAG